MNNATIEYRPAVLADAHHLSELILASQRQFCFHEYTAAGCQLMNELCSPRAIASYIKRGDIYLVAASTGITIGVIGLRDNEHMSHNFVHADWHRRGISRTLWDLARQRCLDNGNPGAFNLRASTYAIDVYRRWGFVQTGSAEDTGGIISTPMELTL